MAEHKSRAWLWYFVGLAVLTATATTILAVFNLKQQLRPEAHAVALAKWQAAGIKDYSLFYSIKRDGSGPTTADYYAVTVKDGAVREARVNGVAEPADRLVHYGMDRLLADVGRFLECDAEQGKPKVYVRAMFSPRTGALAWYVRRVMGTRERIEITVERIE